MLDLYLRDLDRELSRHLASDHVKARLLEIETHLREGAQGRVELGLDLETAERDTVMGFGPAEVVARALVREAYVRGISVRLYLVGGVYTALALLSLVSYRLLQIWFWSVLLPFFVVIAGALGLAIVAFRARRPAPIPLAATGLVAAFGLWLVIGLTTLNLNVYGGHGSVPRWEVGTLLQQERAGREVRSAVRANSSSLSYDMDRLRDDREAIRQAQADPIGNLLSARRYLLGPCFEVTSFSVLLDLLLATLGSVSARRRPRRMPLA